MSQLAASTARARLSLNWPLWLGLALVLGVALLALFGPILAPRDPMQEVFIVQHPVTGKFLKPPFAAFAVPGFPLGTDPFGRDVLSQLLWAVRPTLTLVLVVAALRLSVGVTVGLISGWGGGRAGRVLDALISGALAAPVLFVALCVIAAVGQRWGVWAFIVGLSLTGWAEVARLVREQTRGVKQQPFVEAARALGASDEQVLVRHVLPQILPLVWMLFSFEASSSLLTSAGLGFLGYFVNSIWIPVGDWVGLRASGQPELGQMLATSAEAQRQPWAMLSAGGLVFLTVLGFNLLGEGLRLEMSLERLRRHKTPLGRALQSASDYIEMRWFDPLSAWRRNAALAVAVGGLLTVVVGGGWLLIKSQLIPKAQSAIAVPGGHLWATELHDAQGTHWTDALGPHSLPSIAWVYTNAVGFMGGPVVTADGTLYLLSGDGALHSLTPDGQLRWTLTLPASPYGAPALGELGDVYVAGPQGEMWAVSSEGVLRWTFTPSAPTGLTLSSPIVGPEGTVYWATELHLWAVSVDGAEVWHVALPTYSYASPLPRLNATGAYLFFEDWLFDARTGETLFEETPAPLDKFIVGTDGEFYLRTQEALWRWRLTDTGATVGEYANWNNRALGLGFRFPNEAGVVPDGRVWVYYESGFEYAKLTWLDANHQLLTPMDYPYRNALRFVGIDGDGVAYLCGQPAGRSSSQTLECRANAPGDTAPLWKLELDVGEAIPNINVAPVGAAIPRGTPWPVGGAIVPGRLYVTVGNGVLFALQP